MGAIFRKSVTRPVPAGAEIIDRNGQRFARWRGRGKRAKWITLPVETTANGEQVVRQESGAYFARYRDHDGEVVVTSTRCRDESAAKQVLADLERRVERIRSGVVTSREDAVSQRQASPIGEHVE